MRNRILAVVAISLLLCGCNDSKDDAPPSGGGTASSPSSERLPIPDGDRSCAEHLINMSDGVRLHAWVSSHFPDRKRPILFEFESYAQHENGCPPFAPGDYIPQFMSQEVIDQFTIVHFSYRGTGASEGEFDFSGNRTQADIREAIAWAAAQPFSNGDIILTGQSGTGFAAHFGLLEPAVKAAVIFTSCADMYRCIRRGGVYNGLGEVYLARTMLGHSSSQGDRDRLGTASNPSPLEQTAALTQMAARASANEPFNDFWAERSAHPVIAATTKPVMYTSEPYDIVQSFDSVQLTPNSRFVFGMGHTNIEQIAKGKEVHEAMVRDQVDRFVLHHGLGLDNGAESDPRITLMTSTGGVRRYRAGEALVRYENQWPLEGTHWTKLYLSGERSGSAPSLNDGVLVAQAPQAGSDIIPVVSLPAPETDLRTVSWQAGALVGDSRVREASGLTWTSPVLAQDTEISGPILLNLFATSNAADFDWVVRVNDVWPEGLPLEDRDAGGSHWVTDGYLRASLREVDPEKSLTNGAGDIVRPWHTFATRQAPPAGEVVEYQIDVIPTSHLFRAGHRIRLVVFPIAASSSDRNALGGGVVEVHRGGERASYLQLPLIPNRCHQSTPLVDSFTPPITGCAESWTSAIGASAP